MHISNLAIRSWKNFRDATAKLSRRTFLIGPNASGKSNLLDALRFLRDVSRQGLSAAVEMRGGVSRLRCLAARDTPNIEIDITIQNESNEDVWQYLLEFNQDSFRVPVVRKEIVRDFVSGVTLVDRPSKQDKTDSLLLTQTSLEQISTNQKFRPVAEFLSSISYQHLVLKQARMAGDLTLRSVEFDARRMVA